MSGSSCYTEVTLYGTEAEKGQSKNILQIPKNISNRNIFFKITVEKFYKSKKPLQILRKLADPQITFSIIRKYFANPAIKIISYRYFYTNHY